MMRWTPELVEMVRKSVRRLTVAETAEAMSWFIGRTITAGQIKGVMHRYGIKAHHDGRFRRGHKSWNTGKRCPGLGGSTKFRPGQVNGQAAKNLKPLGTLRKKEGVWEKKVRMDGPPQKRWYPLHRIIWEQHHGPIPAHHVVIFIDGNRDNLDIDNLRMVHRADLAVLNKRGWNDLPAELRPAAINTVQVMRSARERGG